MRLSINPARLLGNIQKLAQVGADEKGGNSRLAATDADRDGRDLVVGWMKAAGLEISIDEIGNIFGTRAGRQDIAPIMTGSHIDTVRSGGALDGCYGVLAGLEVVETLNDNCITTERPIIVGIFTNEEGARFQPDMMGSLVHAGGLSVEEALSATDRDGVSLKEELARIGYAGDMRCGTITPHKFVELHIEQGPILEQEGISIGVVENLQGISWTEVNIKGQSNHAGTTPMYLRHDAGYGAAAITVRVREIVKELGGTQVGTIGKIDLGPNVINVVAGHAHMTVDLRNTDKELLHKSEQIFESFLEELAEVEGLEISSKRLVQFDPVAFDAGVADAIEASAKSRELSFKRMTSGAGHDAQMMARICPTAMIFVPSHNGVSHNPAEHTDDHHLEAGANILLDVMAEMAEA
ncbi:MAG: Zn-dependent hydrolase [Sphingomonadales bacterium]|jgi:N-carbamoyl-L-amino-acid hydrolase